MYAARFRSREFSRTMKVHLTFGRGEIVRIDRGICTRIFTVMDRGGNGSPDREETALCTPGGQWKIGRSLVTRAKQTNEALCSRSENEDAP